MFTYLNPQPVPPRTMAATSTAPAMEPIMILVPLGPVTKETGRGARGHVSHGTQTSTYQQCLVRAPRQTKHPQPTHTVPLLQSPGPLPRDVLGTGFGPGLALGREGHVVSATGELTHQHHSSGSQPSP